MEAFKFLQNQDSQNRNASSGSSTSISDRYTTSFTAERFTQSFPVVAPLFTSEMCVNISIGSLAENKKTLPDETSSSSSSAGNKSLAQQLREEMNPPPTTEIMTQSTTNNESQEKFERQEVKIKNELNSSASSNSTASAAMGGRANGYAPRGRRGRAMAAMHREQQQQQQEQQEKEDEDVPPSASYEVFPPTILSDFKKSVSVDFKMPVNSERAFHALMNCVYLSILLRDRPYGQEITHAQEVAEQSVTFYCDKFAWECHRQSYKFDFDTFMKENKLSLMENEGASSHFSSSTKSEISTFISPFKLQEPETESPKIVESVSNLLFTIRHFLLPISHGIFVNKQQDVWRYWTRVFTSIDDETSVKMCKCQQIAGRLENFRWQVIRKMIDRLTLESSSSSSLENVINSVLIYWDPISVLKRNFPLVFKEWFEEKSLAELNDIVSSPGSFLQATTHQISPMSVAIAELFLNASASSVNKTSSNNVKLHLDPTQASSVASGDTDKTLSEEEKQDLENKKHAIKSFAQDILFLRENGFPKSQQTVASSSSSTTVTHHSQNTSKTDEAEKANNEKNSNTSDSGDKKKEEEDATVKLVSTVMKWWAVLLKEQCPVCSLKVY